MKLNYLIYLTKKAYSYLVNPAPTLNYNYNFGVYVLITLLCSWAYYSSLVILHIKGLLLLITLLSVFHLVRISYFIGLFNKCCKHLSTNTFIYSIVPIITLPKDYHALPYYLSFNMFGVLTIIFYIFSFLLSLVVPYMLYFTYNNLIENKYKVRFITYFLFFSVLFFTIPLLLLIMSMLTAIPSLIFYLHFRFNINAIQRILSYLISFLNRVGILNFLNNLYSKVFFVITDFQYFWFTQSLFFVSLGYMIISRYYVFFVVTNNFHLLNQFHYILLTLSLYLCLCIWTLRLILNLSFFIVSSLQSYNKPILLFGEDLPIPPSSNSNIPPSSNPPSTPPNRYFSFWNLNRHTYNTSYTYARPRWYYMGNLTLGVCTLGLGCVGAYVAYQMWTATEESNRALDRNSQAMNRQSDQADVDAGRMTEQAYIDKWLSQSTPKIKDTSEMSPQEYGRLSNKDKLLLADQSRKREAQNTTSDTKNE